MQNYISEKDAAVLIKALQWQPIPDGGNGELRIEIRAGLDPADARLEEQMTMEVAGTSKIPWEERRWHLKSQTIDTLQEAEYFAAIFNLSNLYIDAEQIDLSRFPHSAMRYAPDTEESRLLRGYADRLDFESLKNWIRKHVYCKRVDKKQKQLYDSSAKKN